MKEDGFPVCCLHSNMEKSERENAFKEFSQFNVFLNKIYGEKLNDLQKISLTEKKSFYKKFCGIGTVYIVLKKIS